MDWHPGSVHEFWGLISCDYRYRDDVQKNITIEATVVDRCEHFTNPSSKEILD